MTRTVRYCFAIPFALGTALMFAPALHARQAAAQPAPAQRQAEAVAVADASDTRAALEEVLRSVPPDLVRVLKLDPSLLENQQYLATYPRVWQFLQQHPEIRQNPRFFLENVGATTYRQGREEDMALARLRAWEDAAGNLTAFAVFLVITGVVLWLTKLIVEQRRWNRLSKIQADAHNKLLDRFAANEDLVAYIQTPAGRRFLESAPIPLREAAPSMGAPYSRILWSLQVGVVLIVAGLGLLVASGRIPDEPQQVFGFFGVVIIALGAGFAVSSGAAYALSRKLGLLDKPSADHA